MKNYPFKRSTLLAGRLIGSSRGVFLLSSLLADPPLSFKNLSGTSSARAFLYSSRKRWVRGEGRNGRETKEDFIFGGPMTLKGASVEEEERNEHVERTERKRASGQSRAEQSRAEQGRAGQGVEGAETRRKRNVLETRIMASNAVSDS